ncbi:uncharacterized protein LOC124623104 [Schistocerca americana]|uniref:uncharacterized protein LOC124623104 n=1 Tax=Schistocerca americana TaxID=7009 RepID=UPI001F5035BB|nr:uncharacterized protein LOC124623104 [Schistocerca americana]
MSSYPLVFSLRKGVIRLSCWRAEEDGSLRLPPSVLNNSGGPSRGVGGGGGGVGGGGGAFISSEDFGAAEGEAVLTGNRERRCAGAVGAARRRRRLAGPPRLLGCDPRKQPRNGPLNYHGGPRRPAVPQQQHNLVLDQEQSLGCRVQVRCGIVTTKRYLSREKWRARGRQVVSRPLGAGGRGWWGRTAGPDSAAAAAAAASCPWENFLGPES